MPPDGASGGRAGPAPNGRVPARKPTVQIDETRFVDNITEAFAALKADPNIFVRSTGEIVTVAREPSRMRPDRDARSGSRMSMRPGTPRIVPLGHPEIRERLCMVARWEKWDSRSNGRAGGYVPCAATREMAEHIAGRSYKPDMQRLDMVSETPIMRPDGTIVQVPGYDAATCCVYMPSESFATIPDAPTLADAKRALEDLREPFCDFFFRAAPDRDVPVAAVLTIIARTAILGSVPLINLDAVGPGIGKSLLADCIATIATGRPAGRMSWPTNDEELEKVLGGYALAGARLICFDNAETRPIASPVIDKVLTAGGDKLVDLRVLGRSETPSMPWNAVVMTTGVNLQITGHTVRRSLLCRQEPPPECEDPEKRTGFKHHPILPWLVENRARLVVAALTLLRAYVVAGCPNQLQLGSFDEWAGLVASAILWAGGANVLDARPDAGGVEADAERGALRVILRDWTRLDATGNGVKVGDALRFLYPPERMRGEAAEDGFGELREAIESMAPPYRPGAMPDARAVGKGLAHIKDRWTDGARLVGKTGAGAALRWHVERVAKASPRAAPAAVPEAAAPPPEPAAQGVCPACQRVYGNRDDGACEPCPRCGGCWTVGPEAGGCKCGYG